MNLEHVLSGPVGQALGWALVHVTWQGTLIAAGLGAVLACTRDSRARYRACAVALLLLVVAPAVTFSVVHSSGAAEALVEGALERAGAAAWPAGADQASPTPASASDAPAWLPQLTGLWMLGVLAFGLRVLVQWLRARLLIRRDVRPAPAPLQRELAVLLSRLQLGRRVRLLLSARVDVPLVVGWLAPVVLLPLGACDVLTPAQVRAVLAHELAHVKRLDGLFNLVQALVEALLFFHPAAWWVSARLRVEREFCCDDVAVAASGSALEYARALATLDALRPDPLEGPGLVPATLSSHGGSLMDRIARLAGRTPARPPRRLLPGATLLLVSALSATGMALAAPADDCLAGRLDGVKLSAGADGCELVFARAGDSWTVRCVDPDCLEQVVEVSAEPRSVDVTHDAVILDQDGRLIEATGKGQVALGDGRILEFGDGDHGDVEVVMLDDGDGKAKIVKLKQKLAKLQKAKATHEATEAQVEAEVKKLLKAKQAKAKAKVQTFTLDGEHDLFTLHGEGGVFELRGEDGEVEIVELRGPHGGDHGVFELRGDDGSGLHEIVVEALHGADGEAGLHEIVVEALHGAHGGAHGEDEVQVFTRRAHDGHETRDVWVDVSADGDVDWVGDDGHEVVLDVCIDGDAVGCEAQVECDGSGCEAGCCAAACELDATANVFFGDDEAQGFWFSSDDEGAHDVVFSDDAAGAFKVFFSGDDEGAHDVFFSDDDEGAHDVVFSDDEGALGVWFSDDANVVFDADVDGAFDAVFHDGRAGDVPRVFFHDDARDARRVLVIELEGDAGDDHSRQVIRRRSAPRGDDGEAPRVLRWSGRVDAGASRAPRAARRPVFRNRAVRVAPRFEVQREASRSQPRSGAPHEVHVEVQVEGEGGEARQERRVIVLRPNGAEPKPAPRRVRVEVEPSSAWVPAPEVEVADDHERIVTT